MTAGIIVLADRHTTVSIDLDVDHKIVGAIDQNKTVGWWHNRSLNGFRYADGFRSLISAEMVADSEVLMNSGLHREMPVLLGDENDVSCAKNKTAI